jgi:hypothetical protein
VQGPQQSDRVDAAGDGYGYAHAGVQRLEPQGRGGGLGSPGCLGSTAGGLWGRVAKVGSHRCSL